jgi:two-component system nitrogen regulation sensor histidine kinase GlnL
VAQDLVIRHGGLIEFESEPGRTQFTILLPIENGDGH